MYQGREFQWPGGRGCLQGDPGLPIGMPLKCQNSCCSSSASGSSPLPSAGEGALGAKAVRWAGRDIALFSHAQFLWFGRVPPLSWLSCDGAALRVPAGEAHTPVLGGGSGTGTASTVTELQAAHKCILQF